MDQMPHVHQFAKQHRRRRGLHSGRKIKRIGSCQVVRSRADATDAGSDMRHPVGFHSHQYFFKPAQLIDD